MKRLFAYFNRKQTNNQIMKLALELKTINENNSMDADLRLKKILANVESAQTLLSVTRKA
jgi:hypothetical protein